MKLRACFVFCVLLALAVGSCSSTGDTEDAELKLNARISALELDGGVTVFHPPFVSAHYEYSANTALDSVSLRIECYNPKARLLVNGASVRQGDWHAVSNLNSGTNTIDISVATSATNGRYKIVITKYGMDDASLTGLSHNHYADDHTLVTGFSSGTANYTCILPYRVASIKFRPTAAAGSMARIRVAGNDVESGTDSPDIPLPNFGSSPELTADNGPFPIEVVAADGVTTKLYSVLVQRKGPQTGNDIDEFIFANLTGPQRVCTVIQGQAIVTGTVLSLSTSELVQMAGVGSPQALEALGISDVRQLLLPSIKVSSNATISLAGAAALPDFRSPVGYIVTSESGASKTYTVTIGVEAPYSVLSVEYQGAVLTERNLGNILRLDTATLDLLIYNRGYKNLTLTSFNFGAGADIAGWSCRDAGAAADGAPGLAPIPPNGYRTVTVRVVPQILGSVSTTFTITSDGDRAQYNQAAIAFTAESFDTPVGNLYIAEWAETDRGTGYSINQGDGYIELKNFGQNPIILDRNTRVRHSTRNKVYTFSKYGYDNNYGAYVDLTNGIALQPFESIVIIERGSNGESNFFSYSWAGGGGIPQGLKLFLVTREPSTQRLINDDERLTQGYAWLERGDLGAANPTIWGRTPDPFLPTSWSNARIVSLIANFASAPTEGNAADRAFWNTYTSTQANRKAGQWPK